MSADLPNPMLVLHRVIDTRAMATPRDHDDLAPPRLLERGEVVLPHRTGPQPGKASIGRLHAFEAHHAARNGRAIVEVRAAWNAGWKRGAAFGGCLGAALVLVGLVVCSAIGALL